MKKTLSLILALCMCLTLGASITGCGSEREDSNHTHSFESSWSYDEEYHWHNCEVDNCAEIADKEVHNWKRHTELDIKATSDEDGVMAYICEVCGKIKKETVTFDGISDTEWNMMLEASNFENYTLQDQTKATIATLSDGSKMEMTTTNILKFADGKVHSSFNAVTDGQESSGSRLYESQDAIFVKNSYAEMFGALKREDFEYDPEANQYIAKQSIEIPVWYTYYGTDGQESSVSDTQQWENVIVELSHGRLAKISYNTIVVSEELGTSTEYEVVYTLSDYGTTTISESGSSLQGAMSEAEWNSMLDASNFVNYTLNYEQSYVNEYSDGSEEERIHSTVAVRMTSDKMAERYLDHLLSDSTWSSWFVYETGESEKYSHEWIFFTLLDGKYNEWQYDADKNIYYAPNGITTTCFMEIPILVEMSSGEVKVSDNGRLSEATFDVIFTDETYGMVQEGVFTFGFSEYGTTVISENITPDPPISTCECKDENKDHFCDQCGEKISDCVDTDDHKCDVCDVMISSYINEDQNALCDICGETHSEGLEFVSNGDGTCYVNGIGTCNHSCVVIPSISPNGDRVTSIGASAFAHCYLITDIVFEKGIDLKTIGDGAFSACYSLVNITIPKSVIEIGGNPFVGCSELKYIGIEEDNDFFEQIDGVLFTTDRKALISYPCGRSEEAYTIPEGVETIESAAFAKAFYLEEIIISETVKFIGQDAFWDTPLYYNFSIRENGGLYIGKHLICVDQQTTGIFEVREGTKYIAEGAFWRCRNLDSIIVPESVEYIGERAFYDCQALKSINIPQGIDTIYQDTFHSCYSLKYVQIPDSVRCIEESAFYNCRSLIAIVIPDSVEHIGDYAFSNCYNLISVTLPDNITDIGCMSFYDCYKLVEVIAPISIANLESFKNSHAKDYLSEFHDGDSKIVKVGDYLFYTFIDGTNYLVAYVGGENRIILPDSYNGEQYEIRRYAFAYNDSGEANNKISEVRISDGVTAIGQSAFWECDNIKSIILPDSVERIDYYAFYHCDNLLSVEIGSGVTDIKYAAFSACTNIVSIKVSKNNTTYKDIDGNLYTKDGTRLVQYAVGKSDTSFIIPGGVMTIDEYAFLDCDSIRDIVLPSSVYMVDSYAFYDCDSLVNVYYHGTIEEWTNICIQPNNTNFTDLTRYYYSEAQPTMHGNYWHYVDGVPKIW